MMTSAQVIKTSANVTSNSPSQDYTHPDDHNLPNYVIFVSSLSLLIFVTSRLNLISSLPHRFLCHPFLISLVSFYPISSHHLISCYLRLIFFTLIFFLLFRFDLPPLDFRVEGVTSISCDTHKVCLLPLHVHAARLF